MDSQSRRQCWNDWVWVVVRVEMDVWNVTVIFVGDDNVEFEQINDIEDAACDWIIVSTAPWIPMAVKQLSARKVCDTHMPDELWNCLRTYLSINIYHSVSDVDQMGGRRRSLRS